MENTRKIYFKDNRKFLKYAILKEHEWYLYRFQKKLRAEEKATDIVSRFIYRFSKNILGTKLGIYIPTDSSGMNSLFSFSRTSSNSTSESSGVISTKGVAALLPRYFRI